VSLPDFWLPSTEILLLHANFLCDSLGYLEILRLRPPPTASMAEFVVVLSFAIAFLGHVELQEIWVFKLTD